MNSSQWYVYVNRICGIESPSAITKIKSISDYFSNLSDKELADEINQHFSTICRSYDECDTLCLCPLPEHNSSIVVTPLQVSTCIQKLKNRKSNIPTGVPTKLIKSANNFITPLLTQILNQSFSTFSFPEKWKIGFVTPLLKKVNCSSLNDIRSITQTDLFSKIAEEFMFSKLYDVLYPKMSFITIQRYLL